MWNIIEVVGVYFLAAGHTHEDIDPSYRRTSKRRRSPSAVNLTELHNDLLHTYDKHVTVVRMKSVANWSGLCDSEHVFQNVPTFAHYKYSSLCQSACNTDSSKSNAIMTPCHVKSNVTEE